MATEHKDITDGTTDSPYDGHRHEPRGVSRAEVNHTYLADGAGGGSWQHIIPHAGCYHTNITTGTSVTPAAADTYEVLTPATIVTHLHDFTHTTPHKLTFTSSEDRHLHMVFNMSFEAGTTAGTAIFGIRKNGSGVLAGSEAKRYFANGNPGVVALHFDDVATDGDSYEVIWQHLSTARQCNVFSTYFFIMGMPQ